MLLKNRCKSKGLTEQEYHEILWFQNDQCAICQRAFSDTLTPYIDHDHASGEVRGLLCSTCNTALGKFRDSRKVLARAMAYLERHGR